MKTLVVAEKEQQAKVIAQHLDARELELRRTEDNINYWDGPEWVIVPARGHLVSYKIKGLNKLLPLEELPKGDFYSSVSKDAKPRLRLIKEVVECSDIGNIIIGTDFDREGEVIGYSILNELGLINSDNPISLGELELHRGLEVIGRAYFSTLEAEEIREAFHNPRQVNERLLAQGLARNLDDALTGLNLSKAMTYIYKKAFGKDHLASAIPMGRVQSPTLAYIYKETRTTCEIHPGMSEDRLQYTNHFITLDGADYRLRGPQWRKAEGDTVQVTDVVSQDEQEEQQAMPMPNTTDILADITAIDSPALMTILEEMYLKGLTTYPRTESHHMPARRLEELEELLSQANQLPERFGAENYPRVEEDVDKTAISLTEKGLRKLLAGELQGREEIIGDYLRARLIRSFATPLRVRNVKIKYRIGDEDYEEVWKREVINPDDAVMEFQADLKPEITAGHYPLKTIHVNQSALISEEVFRPRVEVPSSKEVEAWMTEVPIGTEATRPTYIPKLKASAYLDEANLPTLLGAEVARTIEEIRLNEERTGWVEQRIRNIRTLEELPAFKEEVLQFVDQLILGLKGVVPSFKCPMGHDAILQNTRSGLYLLCETCGEFYSL